MPNKGKIKGYLLEKKLTDILNENGIEARRGGRGWEKDVYIKDVGTMEAKCWKKGMATIYKQLGNNAFLALKWQSKEEKDRPILIVMDFGNFMALLTQVKAIK